MSAHSKNPLTLLSLLPQAFLSHFQTIFRKQTKQRWQITLPTEHLFNCQNFNHPTLSSLWLWALYFLSNVASNLIWSHLPEAWAKTVHHHLFQRRH